MGILAPMLTARFLIFLCLGVALFEGVSQAREPFMTGKMKWEVDAKEKLVLSEQALLSVLDIDVSYEVAEADPENPPKPKPPETGVKKFGSRRVMKMQVSDAEKRLVYQLSRSTNPFSTEKEGLRMLDEISRIGLSGDLQFTIKYKTRFDPKSGVKARQLSHPTGDKGALALALVPGDKNKLSTIFLMGGLDDGWSRKIDAGEDYVEWSYSGRLQESEEIYLLHSVAFCKADDPKDLQATFDTLIVKGMPFDTSLSERVRNNLVNFPVTIKAPDASKDDSVDGVKLVWLDRVLEPLKLKRVEDKDLLQLDGSESVEGTFYGSTLKIGDQALKQEDIAAILGEQGTRESRVFMRDGRVMRGRLDWAAARFESGSLGSITLKPQSPGRIVLRRGKNDGLMTPKPVAWMADGRDGQVLPVRQFPPAPLRFRWLGGTGAVPWQEVVTFRSLPAPALESELVLRDGSRWRGWMEWDASLGMPATHWAQDVSTLMRLFEEPATAPATPKQPAVTLLDGSVIVGEAALAKLGWRRQAGDMEIKVMDVAAVKMLPSHDDDAMPVFELTMKSGTQLTGHPQDNVLLWKRGAETLRLSWAWIQSIQISPLEAVK